MPSKMSPLTFGQMSTLRHLQKWPRERWPDGNLVSRHRIAPGVRITDVRAHLDLVAGRHAAMRTIFCLGDPMRPTHTVADALVGDPLVVAEADEAEKAIQQAFTARFDFENDHGWQATVVLDGSGAPAELILVMSHLIADGWSVRRVSRSLGPIVVGGRPDSGPAFAGLTTQLAGLQRGDDWAAARQTAESYWRKFLLRAPLHRLQQDGVGASADRTNKGMLALAAQHRDIISIARCARTFPTGVILGFVGLALMRTCREPVLPIALMSSNRGLSGWQELVSTMNQQIPIIFHQPDPAASVHEFLSAAQRAALSAYQNSCYDVDMVDNLADELLRFTPRSYGPMINFLGPSLGAKAAVPVPAEPAVRPTATVEPSARGMGFDIYLEISSSAGPGISMWAVEQVLPAPEVRSCLNWIADAIALTAERGDLPIHDLPTFESEYIADGQIRH